MENFIIGAVIISWMLPMVILGLLIIIRYTIVIISTIIDDLKEFKK